MAKNQNLLQVENLELHFRTTNGVVQAVDGVSFALENHSSVVVLGESGCGKTSFAKAILRLLPRNVHKYSGKVIFEGKDVMTFTDEDFRRNVRWVGMSMVPQAALNSLNPVMRIGDQVAEPAMIHHSMDRDEAWSVASRMVQHVGVPSDFLQRYPFELSGGMRQRAAIAMALVTLPSLIILDEPTSALDLLTQANIMNVLKRIKEEFGTSYILITHDIATSSELAENVAVMYAGQIVEVSDARRFFTEPLHPYSQKLMASVPRVRGGTEPEFITGTPPSLLNPPTGCRFKDRCTKRFEKCDEEPPVIDADGILVKCWLYGEE